MAAAPAPQRLPEPSKASLPPGPAAPPPAADVFSLKPSHLLFFGFALLAAMAVAVGMSQPELLTEWRESLTAPAEPEEGAPVALPPPGAIEAAGLRAWRDEKAQVRIRATLVNHQMSPAPDLEYEVSVFARVEEDQGRLLGKFTVQLDEPIEGRSSKDVEALLNAPDGLADFPHWSELVGRVGPPQAAVEESGE